MKIYVLLVMSCSIAQMVNAAERQVKVHYGMILGRFIQNGKMEDFKLFLQQAIDEKYDFNRKMYGDALLQLTIKNNKPEMAKLLLQAKIQPSDRTLEKAKETPAMETIFQRYINEQRKTNTANQMQLPGKAINSVLNKTGVPAQYVSQYL